MGIDWWTFSIDLRAQWKRPVDLARELCLSQSTVMAAWHGKPIGVLPMLKACRAMGAHPLRYLVDQPEDAS